MRRKTPEELRAIIMSETEDQAKLRQLAFALGAKTSEAKHLHAARDALQAKLDMANTALGKIALRMELDADAMQRIAIKAIEGTTNDWNSRADLSADLVRAALEAAAHTILSLGETMQTKWRAGHKSDSHLEGMSDACDDYAEAIRGIAADPEAVAAIVAQVMEGKP